MINFFVLSFSMMMDSVGTLSRGDSSLLSKKEYKAKPWLYVKGQ